MLTEFLTDKNKLVMQKYLFKNSQFHPVSRKELAQLIVYRGMIDSVNSVTVS